MRLVLFDCDGTLVDSQHIIDAAMRQAFAARRLAAPARERTLAIVGLSLPEAFLRLVPELAADEREALALAYKEAFAEMRRANEPIDPLYPGARELIESLSRRRDTVLGIATGKSRRGLEGLLEREGLGSHFSTLQTADSAPSKPHPGMIEQAMRATGMEPEVTVMIGDTSYDMAMALNAGVRGIGVTWGYHPLAELVEAGAHRIVASFAELTAELAQAPGSAAPGPSASGSSAKVRR